MSWFMMCQVQVKPAPRESAPGWLEPRPIPRGNVLSNMGTTITHPFGNGLYHLFYGDVGDGVLLFYPHFFFWWGSIDSTGPASFSDRITPVDRKRAPRHSRRECSWVLLSPALAPEVLRWMCPGMEHMAKNHVQYVNLWYLAHRNWKMSASNII